MIAGPSHTTNVAHPEVALIQPTSVASPSAGISNSTFAVAESMEQGGCAVSSHKALHNWHTIQHVLSPAQIKARQVRAAGTVVEHGHSFALHDRINWQIDGLKCAEENQSKLSVAGSNVFVCAWLLIIDFVFIGRRFSSWQ
jgi:hypothetical protein